MNGTLTDHDVKQTSQASSVNDKRSTNDNTKTTNENTQHKYQKKSIKSSGESDYYTLLGVARNATEDDIKKAFKKLAFLYHPDKNKEQDSARKFAKISAAFDVLSNPSRRRMYDAHYRNETVKRSATFNYGTAFLNGKIPRESFFNEFNGFSNVYNENDFASGDDTSARIVYKDPPIYHDLFVTLEEILDGVTKKVKVTRKVFKSDHSSKLEEKTLVIQIKPGWKAGTKIIFEREGDRRPGVLPADIIFVLKDKPHPLFKRSGSDIIFTAKINLKAALLGDQMMIPMLNRESKLLKWTEVINPKSEKRLRGMGLPNSTISGSRGDLIVRFDITFPKRFSEQERQLVSCAIPPFTANYDVL